MLFLESGQDLGLIEIVIQGRTTSRHLSLNNVLVVDRLPPRFASSVAAITQILSHPHLRDILYPRRGHCPVGLLIGQDCPKSLTSLDSRIGLEGGPFAVRMQLRWVVSGPMEIDRTHRDEFHRKCLTGDSVATTGQRVEEMISKLWKTDARLRGVVAIDPRPPETVK